MGKRKRQRGQQRSLLTEDTQTSPALLTECRFLQLDVVESAESSGALRVRGEFARVGAATENGRVYGRRLWESNIGRLRPSFGGRQVFGELDHPDDGRTKLQRASHIITNLWVEGNIVMGEAEILPTRLGEDLAAILRSGCRVGVSSRGYGSTRPDAKGNHVVQEDYKLVTFDFVADPADQQAYPEVVSEETRQNLSQQTQVLFEGASLEEILQEVSKVKEVSADDIENRVQAAMEAGVGSESKDDAEPSIESVQPEGVVTPAPVASVNKDEVLNNILTALSPLVIQEKSVSESQELKRLRLENQAQKLQIEELEEEVSKAHALARLAGFNLYLNNVLRENPDAQGIQEMLGDLGQYETAEEFQSKLASIQEAMGRRRERLLAEEAERARIVQRAQEENHRLAEQNEAMRQKLQEAAVVMADKELRLYAESRIGSHPQAYKIREILNTTFPLQSTEQVDNVINQFRSVPRSPEQIQETSARVRGMMGGGYSPSMPLDEENYRSQPGSRVGRGDFNGLGVPLNELRPLMPPGTDGY